MPRLPTAHAPPRTAFAWAVILLLCGGIGTLQACASAGREGDEDTANLMVDVQIQIQFGLRSFAERLAPEAGIGASLPDYRALEEVLGGGPLSRRTRFAVVAAELRGPGKALSLLDEAEGLLAGRGASPGPEQARIVGALRALWAGGGDRLDPGAPGRLDEGQREALRGGLGWTGRLALAPPGSPDREPLMALARRRAAGYLAGIVCLLLLLGLGLAGVVAFWIRVARRGRPVLRFEGGRTPPGIYAETFAAWLAAFILLSWASGRILRGIGEPGLALPVAAAVLPLSLAALAWPVLRGVPWARVRDDVGLRFPASPVRDLAAGVSCWVMGLPAMAVGLILGILILRIRTGLGGPAPADPLEAPGLPSHPVVGEAARGADWVLLFWLAVVMAPVIEETFFRGVLYRHLRDATAGGGRTMSVLLSGGISSFLFAVVHPQGPAFVPGLMAVAFSMVHAREWRGSLLAPVAAHALHNGFLFAGLRFLVGPG